MCAYHIKIASSRISLLENYCSDKRNYKMYLWQWTRPAYSAAHYLRNVFAPIMPLAPPRSYAPQKHPRLDSTDMGMGQCSSPVDVTSLLHLASTPTVSPAVVHWMWYVSQSASNMRWHEHGIGFLFLISRICVSPSNGLCDWLDFKCKEPVNHCQKQHFSLTP